MIENIKKYPFLWIYLGLIIILGISAAVVDLLDGDNNLSWLAYLVWVILGGLYCWGIYKICNIKKDDDLSYR